MTIQQFQVILDSYSQLLGTKGAIIIDRFCQGMSYYNLLYADLSGERDINNTLYLGTRQPRNELICDAIDCLADILRASKVCFSEKRQLPFLSIYGRSICMENIAEELYITTRLKIFEKYRQTAGLDFDCINFLSNTPYEGEKASGYIGFLPIHLLESDKQNREIFRLQNMLLVRFTGKDKSSLAFTPTNIRQVRKLLVGAKGQVLLLCSAEDQGYYCCGYLDKEYLNNLPYYVSIQGPFKWGLWREGTPVLCLENNTIKVWKDDVSVATERILEIFSLKEQKKKQLHKIIQAISMQHHGSSVVFLDLDQDIYMYRRIEELVARKRAISIAPLHILGGIRHDSVTEETLKNLSGIDGAIIIDIHSLTLRYVATIVDGRACTEGRLDRGARHNSLMTFIKLLGLENPHGKAAALIFSEDGGIQLV